MKYLFQSGKESIFLHCQSNNIFTSRLTRNKVFTASSLHQQNYSFLSKIYKSNSYANQSQLTWKSFPKIFGKYLTVKQKHCNYPIFFLREFEQFDPPIQKVRTKKDSTPLITSSREKLSLNSPLPNLIKTRHVDF